ncbi:MAG: TM2 domain-containing protein [Planctomycetes bacterium]|nr:TM2 domain-containing protein [Planctomycetota bacterium]
MTKKKSEKSYALAVCLSAIFGVLGIHFFYIGRYVEGIFDLGLSIYAFYLFTSGSPGLGLIAFAIDAIHTFVITIMLLTGSSKDGKGHYICYPGQILKE